jgi:hypothetical protein
MLLEDGRYDIDLLLLIEDPLNLEIKSLERKLISY